LKVLSDSDFPFRKKKKKAGFRKILGAAAVAIPIFPSRSSSSPTDPPATTRATRTKDLVGGDESLQDVDRLPLSVRFCFGLDEH
jgi:hypothetical protein